MPQNPTSRIIWPHQGLQSLLFCILERDIRDAELSRFERFNFFPASPLCCVSITLSGALYLISESAEMEFPKRGKMLAPITFSGPQPGPAVSWSSNDLHALTFAFYPDAFAKLADLDLTPYSGKVLPIDEILTQPLVQAFTKLHAQIVDQSWSSDRYLLALEQYLGHWQSSGQPETARSLDEWTEDVLGTSRPESLKKSRRQIARNIKSRTGLSERELKNLNKAENLYANINAAKENDKIDWADIAAQAGFADQAHMIRRMRQHTGFTPAQLRREVEIKESLWPYRLLREYFDMPPQSEQC